MLMSVSTLDASYGRRRLLRAAGGVATGLVAIACLMIAGPEMAYTFSGAPGGWAILIGLFFAAVTALWLCLWTVGGQNPFASRPLDRRSHRPRRLWLARVSLLWAAIVAAALAASLPWWKPTVAEAISLANWLAVCLASVAGTFMLWRPHALGRWLIVVLGAYAVVQLPMSWWGFARQSAAVNGPAIYTAFLAVTSSFVALICAALCVLSVRAEWPNVRDDE